MSTFSNSTTFTPAQSTTGTRKRIPIEKIKYNRPGSVAPTFLLTADFSGDGKSTWKPGSGLIKKTMHGDRMIEWFYQNAPAVAFKNTASGSSGATAVTVATADAPHFIDKRTIYNPKNGAFAAIYSVNTGTGVVSATTVGDVAWAIDADDYCILLATAYEDGSSSPAFVSQTEDNAYNVMQELRESWKVGNVAAKAASHVGDTFGNKQDQALYRSMQLLENSLYFSRRATSGETTTVDSADITTMQGMWHWASAGLDLTDVGALTKEYINGVVYPNLPNTMSINNEYVMVCGRKVGGAFNALAQSDSSYCVDMSDSMSKTAYGKWFKKYNLGPLTVRMLPTQVFDTAGLDDKALIFSTDDVEIVAMEGLDVHVNTNIQNNDVHARQDEVTGVLTLKVKSAGYEMARLSGISA